ncbi:MAG TPA: DUF2950 family protein [Pseudacidobacterium sp.]|nr:DUF2950 family protein [Pseudacidobacterium sp.]
MHPDSTGGFAPRGAQDYMVNGRPTRGFAFVASPAEYRNSGVITFIVKKTVGSHPCYLFLPKISVESLRYTQSKG